MEFLVPIALAAVGSLATAGAKPVGVRTGGMSRTQASPIVEERAETMRHPLIANNTGLHATNPNAFTPLDAHLQANSLPNRQDNIAPLTSVYKDPKYALTPDAMEAIDYDQRHRGGSELENQWYYSGHTRDSETPLSMGYLPEWGRSLGITLRDPDTPEMLKPKKRELTDEEVWVAQPEQDRRHYTPILGEQSRRARNESKYASGSGALDGFMMNDSPGNLGGAWKGWSTGEVPTRQFTGYHPQQRFFRKFDGKKNRNPHGLRAGNKESHHREMRSDLEGQYSNLKKDQLSNYHQIPVADGGRKHPHLAHDLRKVDLRHTQRDIPTAAQEAQKQRNSGGATLRRPNLDENPIAYGLGPRE